MRDILKQTAYLTGGCVLPLLWLLIHYSCNPGTADKADPPATVKEAVAVVNNPAESASVMADAATILSRQEVPILCYHQVRDWKESDSKTARAYIVPEAIFADQVRSLADSGYHTILPHQLYEYLAYNKPLPSKPVMITFDDTRLDQFTTALPELNKYGFKAAFFIMTVSLGKPGYMSKDQVKQLSDEGHTIGSHTYDHQNVKKYADKDWQEQIAKPSKQLQEITGKKIEYFAYPFGLWNREAIPHLKEHGFKSVFQLSTDRDTDDPLFTIRRIIVTGDRGGTGMQKLMKNSFH
ncbi:MAG: polysaccharide deacetylase family protein [Chitinophagaceae bacterium]|nr:polysaccharide deacetylase family protein [Chitinophagaceae bacterium]